MIDIAKIQLLLNNTRLTGSLLCIVIASQQIMLAIVYERYISVIIKDRRLWFIVDLISNIGTAVCLYEMLKAEKKEVKSIKNDAEVV